MMSCDQYCRLCLKEDKWGTPVHIFEENAFDESLGEVINILSGTSILKDDGLPDIICRKCLGIITIFMDFRVKVNKNYTFLKSVLKISENSANAPVVDNDKCKSVSDDTPIFTASENYRRPGPKSKSKLLTTKTSTIVGPELKAKTSTTEKTELSPKITPTPSFSSEKTEIEPLNDRIWNPTPSENSDATTLSHKSSNQGNISDSSGSMVQLDKSRNANSVTRNYDNDLMELDRPITETIESINEVQLDGFQGFQPQKKRRGRPPRMSFFCEHCNRPFSKSKDYKNHKLLHKRLGAKIFLCSYCGMAYESDYEVTLHCKCYHQFASLDVLKQKQLEQRSVLTPLPHASTLNTATNSSNNLNLIESAEPRLTTGPTNKRKRPTKQGNTCKKVKSSAAIVIVADVHSPMQEEQPNEADSSVTVAVEIHNQQPTETLECKDPSTGTLTSQSEIPATDVTNTISKPILKRPSSTKFKFLEINSKNSSDPITLESPVESAKDNSPTKLGKNSSVDLRTVVDEHPSTATKQSDEKMTVRSTSIDDNNTVVIVSSEEEMSGSTSSKSLILDEDIRKRQDEKLGKSAVDSNVPTPATPVKATQPVVIKVRKCDSPIEAKVCNICHTFKSTNMRGIFLHKKTCRPK